MNKTVHLICTVALLSLFAGCQKKEIEQPPSHKQIDIPSPAAIKQQIEEEEEEKKEEIRGIVADDFNIGKNISKLEFTPLYGGKKVTLGSVIKGRSAVIDFWSTWCRPCVLMLPDMEKAHKKLQKDVAVISLSLDPARDAAQKVIKEKKCTFPTFVGDADLINSGIILPQTVIVNSKGIVTFVGHGRHTFEEIITMVNKYNR
ncbi:TlpA family protein disulfide reductase [bacterium]|nr:TlpA family protein disulfide reductase [bacterium]